MLLILFCIISLSLFGCSENNFNKYQQEIQENPSFCNTFIGEEKDLCYSFAAGIRFEPQLCDNVLSEETKKECYFEVGGMSGFKLEDCTKLSNDVQKERCYFDVAESITPESDITICEQWPEEWNYICYTYFAKTKYEVPICDNYVSNEIKLEYDEQDYITLRESCYEAIAITNSNPNLCKFDECSNQIAISTQDLSLCKNQDCYSSYAIKFNDIDACKLIKDESLRNSCYVQVAENTNNIKICKNVYVTEEPFKQECWTDEKGREHCTLESTSYLDKTEEYKVTNCYLRIATDDPDKCQDVADDSVKLMNECYYRVSKNINNLKLCKNIVIPEIDEVTCEDYVKHYGLVLTE